MTEQKVAGKTTFVLKDPATSRFFRLKEAEYFIAQQLDGSTRPEAICQRAEEKLGARLSSQTLEEFIATQRGKRMWVTFAGSFFDLLVWAAATLIRRLTEPEVWVHSAALVLIGTLGIEIGQQVLLKARAHPQRTYRGKVVSIAPLATEGGPGEGRTVLISTLLENALPFLRPEMTGMAKICCGERDILDILTRRIARYVRVEFWSWW